MIKNGGKPVNLTGINQPVTLELAYLIAPRMQMT